MASNNTKKQVHVSPGIYFSESELSVATKSLGITNLGLAGETLKGPAFQPIEVSSWAQYQSYFGGTSTEKFEGSQYPKYELPYIAKTYLEESQNLKVCRVLGLSGVNAGPAWILYAYGEGGDPQYGENNPMVVAVIRSRGYHKKAALIKKKGEEPGICEDQYEYDKLVYLAKSVSIVPSNKLILKEDCTNTFDAGYDGYDKNTNNFVLNSNIIGKFTFRVELTEGGDDKYYSVSLNPNDKNYIYNVIGGNPEIGEAEIYVEELYDVTLKELIERGDLTTLGRCNDLINGLALPKYIEAKYIPDHEDVDSLLVDDESMLRRSDVGKRFLASNDSKNNETNSMLGVHISSNNGKTWTEGFAKAGHIYQVVAFTDTTGKRNYYYGEYQTDDNPDGEVLEVPSFEENDSNCVIKDCVFVKDSNMCYVYDDEINDVVEITLDLNNYKEQYRYSSTPWIVSEIKGSAEKIELTKLFRFHTISDGNSSCVETKISIENIDTEANTFDVLVRDFNDTDISPVILERYKGVDLIPGSPNYIAYRIGSFDEGYESKSQYVTVEVNETEKTQVSSPAGFLGYPVRNYEKGYMPDCAKTGLVEGMTLKAPYFLYNTDVFDEIRVKKQYFGMSDLVGIDSDVLKYKGAEAYNGQADGLTPGFHLDSRLNAIEDQTISVDGETDYKWVTVGNGNTVGNFSQEPRIGNAETMRDTLYEDKRWRKFTLCFYGGFDGWDYYRKSRSNSDDFKTQRYRGNINWTSLEGINFSVLRNPQNYGFDKSEKAITSDWYAYMYGIRQFANPKEIDINVFATPGIDYVNNNTLVGETIDMIEEERADSIYVITTPDKPFGASDSKQEMYTAEQVVDNLDDSEIDTNWACTYYPWVKYFDSLNNQYIYLPPTKDVVKNFAYTDNVAAPWLAAAGWNRGLSDGIKSKKNLVLAEQDELYSGRVNFINNFADEGMRIWGDKNLQITESKAHMNRISKRRCLIRLRKLISIACVGLLFDPNDPTMISSFKSAINPILEDFISRKALTDAKLVVDDSEEARQRLEINAQIYLKFMPNLEYINIGLVATPEGVSFDDI